MGDVRHWVTRIEPAKIIAAVIYAAALVACANILANAPRPKGDLTVVIHNEGNKPVVKAYKVGQDGKLVPVK